MLNFTHILKSFFFVFRLIKINSSDKKMQKKEYYCLHFNLIYLILYRTISGPQNVFQNSLNTVEENKGTIKIYTLLFFFVILGFIGFLVYQGLREADYKGKIAPSEKNKRHRSESSLNVSDIRVLG